MEKESKVIRKKIREEIEIPEDVKVEIIGDIISLSKNGNRIDKRLVYPTRKEDNKIIVENAKANKKDKKLIKSNAAHIRSIISGLKEKYVYKLQICSVHFPMNVSVQGKEIVIKNFLGEAKDRKAKILEGVDVKVDKEVVTVESSDKEKAGQTAANIEKATRIRRKDLRTFQDGIFIIEKSKGRREK